MIIRKTNEEGEYEVSSESKADEWYKIFIDSYGSDHKCDCISFKMGRRRPCKHIILILNKGDAI